MNPAALLDALPDGWTGTLALAAAAALLALVACAVALALLRPLVARSVFWGCLVARIRQPAYLVLPLVALQFVIAAAPDGLPMLSGVARAVSLALIAALVWLGLRAVRAVNDAVIKLHPSNVSDNLEARRVQTQTRVLSRTVMFLIVLVGVGAALMTFPNVRQVGASLLASAGVAGLVAGIAARPVIGNLIAGLQIALTQPIRLDDVVIVEGQWGRIEELTATYVVVKLWDERRLVVPLQWIIENPFENWTRREAKLTGTVLLWLDYRVDLAPLRAELERVCAGAPEWDGRVALLQVVETSERAMQVRVLVSASDASRTWDLRCRVREALIYFLQRQQPDGLPRMRAEVEDVVPTPRRGPTRETPRTPGVGDSSAIRHPEHPKAHAPEEARSPEGGREEAVPARAER
jgi:small-conductance mechanosensitive channel